MKSFKDANKVATKIGDMVSIKGTFNGETICTSFLVTRIERKGSKVEVRIENQSEGQLIIGSRSLVSEM
jgi:hypothetical protein